MSGKISKKNQDPNQVHKDAAALEAMSAKKSQHFAVGTYVIAWRNFWGQWRSERAEVLDRPGNGFMLVRWEDQTTDILRPNALAHERYS